MKRHFVITMLGAALLVSLSSASQNVVAQSFPAFAMPYVIGICSMADYDAVAAKVLGITTTDLRTALVSGQTLDEIARTQNIAVDTVRQALLDVHLAEIDQAVNDSLLDKQQAQQIKTYLLNARSVPRKPPYPPLPNYPLPVYALLTDVTAYNFQAVRPLQAAARAIDLKCADLVRALIGGRSIVALAASRGGPVGPVVDAMIKAYQDALDEDVKAQLITAVQAKGLRVQVAERVAALINQAGQPVLMQTLNLPGFAPGYPTYPEPGAAQGGMGSGISGATPVGPLPPVNPPPAVSTASIGATGSNTSGLVATPIPK